ncbi:sporulation protein Meu14 [Schizosaccharomyces japonicus yFS275]|uniref:Sporulation protein Meu14 n=1 Tax=Schizosaccharomyces japonicus (strain yFS275 / FY16936) TaxID=402676 RepID=B6JVJ4_SCHJY|nr:sporulation protein Meu14 [Schizosaccharomyces japonicus yFS275]EEB05395.1 sporulation protein Meu14 [Schizosaccharomyces japonicus yFS275]
MQRSNSLRVNGVVQDLPKRDFSLESLRELSFAEESRRSNRLVKTSNSAIDSFMHSSKGLIAVGSLLSDWGSQSENACLNDISDKLGVLICEMGDSEEAFARQFEKSRIVLKSIRNLEHSMAPIRLHRERLSSEIDRLLEKEPSNPRLPDLQNSLVRAEAENLVGEAQLSNVSREKLKESYTTFMDAVRVRAQKQLTLAYYAQQLLDLVDGRTMIPGDTPPEYNKDQADLIMDECNESMLQFATPKETIAEAAEPELENTTAVTSTTEEQSEPAPLRPTLLSDVPEEEEPPMSFILSPTNMLTQTMDENCRVMPRNGYGIQTVAELNYVPQDIQEIRYSEEPNDQTNILNNPQQRLIPRGKKKEEAMPLFS